jgi:hypothetical protein
MPNQRWIVGGILVAGLVMAVCPPASALSTHSVTLEWTAPGDDSLSGIAKTYDIRYSREPITEARFLYATRINSYLLPGPPGTLQRFTIFGLTPGIRYYFAVRTGDDNGNWSRISNVVSYDSGALDVVNVAPAEAHFSNPWPNPASNLARFTLSLPEPQWVRIEAFDLAGRVVRTLALGQYSGGTFDLVWDLRDGDGRLLRAGAYLVRGQIGEDIFLRRVTIVH